MFIIRFRRILIPLLIVSLWQAAPAMAADRDRFDVVSAGTSWMKGASEQVSGWVSLIVQFFSSDPDPDPVPSAVVIPNPPPPDDDDQ